MKPGNLFESLWMRLTTPRHPSPEAEARRARLVAALSLSLAAVGGIAFLIELALGAPVAALLVIFIATAILGAAYRLSRTRTAEAGLLLLFILIASPFLVSFEEENPRILVFLGLSVLTASLVASLRLTILVFLIALGAVAVFIFHHPHTPLDEILNTAFLIGTLGALAWISAALRMRDQRKIEEGSASLSESEERYHLLFSRMLDAFALHEIVCDERGVPVDYRFLEVNPAFERMTGLKASDIIGRTALEVMPGIEAYWIETYGRVALTGESIRFENYSAALGKYFDVVAFSPRPGQFATIFTDTTLRKQAEEDLRKSEERHRSTLDNMLEGCQIIGFDWRYLYLNDAVVAQSGYRREELMGRTMMEKYPGIEHTELFAVLERCMKERLPYRMENEFTFPDGSKGWYDLSIQPVEEGLFILSHDITERKRAEKQIEKQNLRLKVLREIDAAILASDSVENIVRAALDHIRELIDCERANVALIEWEKNEAVNFDVRDTKESAISIGARVSLDLIRDVLQILSRNQPIIVNDLTLLPDPPPQIKIFIQEGLRSRCILPLFSQDKLIGAFTLSSEIPGFFDEEKVGLGREVANQVAIALTQNALLRELRELNAELEERVAERTAALHQANLDLERALRVKDEFLANMSHELRTPLNAIIGLSDSLSEKIAGDLNEKQAYYIGMIRESGQHLLELINDILDLAKIEAGRTALEKEEVDVSQVCDSSLRMVKELALKKNLEVSLELDPDLVRIRADGRRLKQMLVNLLTNAVKFTPENGKIGLQTRGDREKGAAQFTVWDTGIGIAEEDLPRLFQPFVQLESNFARQSTGTGLGLALVAKMAALHGGSVSVESQPGRGSRFTITLP